MYALSKYLWRQWILYLILTTTPRSAYYYLILQIRKLRFRLHNLAQTRELITGRPRTPARICLTPKTMLSNPILCSHSKPNSVVDASCCPNAQYLVLWGILDLSGQFVWVTVINIKLVLTHIWIQLSFFPTYSNANGNKRSQFPLGFPAFNNFSDPVHVYSILYFLNKLIWFCTIILWRKYS